MRLLVYDVYGLLLGSRALIHEVGVLLRADVAQISIRCLPRWLAEAAIADQPALRSYVLKLHVVRLLDNVPGATITIVRRGIGGCLLLGGVRCACMMRKRLVHLHGHAHLLIQSQGIMLASGGWAGTMVLV